MAEPAAPGIPPLRSNRDFRLLWLGSAVSVLGSRASAIAYPLLVLALTGSPADAGLAGFAATVPYLLWQLPAGALVDRWNRRRIMIACDAGRALALASIVLALALDCITLAQIVLVSFIEGSLYVFHSLAEPAAVRNLVHPTHLPLALSQIEVRERGAALLGQPLGGFLFDLGRAVPFLADALSYLASLSALLLIRGRFESERAPHGPFVAEIVQGLVWLGREPFLRATALLIAGSNLLFQALNLLVIVIAREQGASSTAIGLLLAGFGGGGVLGSLAAPWFQRRLPMKAIVIGANWVWALALPGIGLADSLLVVGALLALMAFVGPLWNVAMDVYRLLITPDELQGKVGSVISLLAWGAMPLGSLLAGFLLDSFGSWTTTMVLAAAMALVAVAASVSPAIRRAPSNAGATPPA
ncbi:MAG TPA: MFS transporter [Candidatus Acidoferrum sp.]|nr:MFS transporter [Candidatus Acidoferrum sp.]